MLRVAATCHSSLAIFTMDGFPRCFRSPRSSLISLNFLPTSRSTLSRISNNQRSKSRRGSVKLSYRERYCVLTFKRRSSKSIRDLRSFKIGHISVHFNSRLSFQRFYFFFMLEGRDRVFVQKIKIEEMKISFCILRMITNKETFRVSFRIG